MWISIGLLEIGLVTLTATVAVILLLAKQRLWKWCAVGAGCLATAALFTPADPASTLLFGMLLLAAFTLGARFSASLKSFAG